MQVEIKKKWRQFTNIDFIQGKMGTVPTQPIACLKIISKMRLVERANKLSVCGLSPFFQKEISQQSSGFDNLKLL